MSGIPDNQKQEISVTPKQETITGVVERLTFYGT